MTDKTQSSIGEFVTASGEKLNLDQAAISRVVLVGATGTDKPETLLSKLDADELAELEKWTAAQTGSPVNLMRWPGWPEALRRHVIESKAGGNNA